MSFILDALRKIDREKKTAGAGAEVVMEGGRRWGDSRKGLVYAVGGLGLLTVAALGLAALALMQARPSDQRSQPAPPSRGAASPAVPPAPVVSAPPAPAPASSQPAAAPGGTAAELEEPKEDPGQEEEVVGPPVRMVGRGAQPGRAALLETPPSPAPTAGGSSPNLALQGTSVIDGKPVAVINYQRVFEGDIVQGARVVKISDRVVELEYEGRRFTIQF